MTLCEALDWCRVNNAILYMNKKNVRVSARGKNSVGVTIEEAVGKLAGLKITAQEPAGEDA